MHTASLPYLSFLLCGLWGFASPAAAAPGVPVEGCRLGSGSGFISEYRCPAELKTLLERQDQCLQLLAAAGDNDNQAEDGTVTPFMASGCQQLAEDKKTLVHKYISEKNEDVLSLLKEYEEYTHGPLVEVDEGISQPPFPDARLLIESEAR